MRAAVMMAATAARSHNKSKHHRRAMSERARDTRLLLSFFFAFGFIINSWTCTSVFKSHWATNGWIWLLQIRCFVRQRPRRAHTEREKKKRYQLGALAVIKMYDSTEFDILFISLDSENLWWSYWEKSKRESDARVVL